MNAAQLLNSTTTRLRRPGTWGGVLLFGGLWNSLRWLTGPESFSPGEFMLPLVLGALLLVLAALPWQWTGDDRPMAGFARGMAQALPWNLFLAVLLATLLPAHGRPGGRGAPGFWFLPALPPRLLILLVACGAFGLLAGWILADRDQEALKAKDQALLAAGQARLARQAQARALQAQMNPHVLFNTLSGLAELAREDGAATETALVELAGLLRRLLKHTAQSRVSLEAERTLVEGWLALEKLRLGDRLKVRWLWDEGLENMEIPPLLLQPLVENALKHGIGPCREGGELEIGLAGEPSRLRLWVANTGKAMPSEIAAGTGLSNLKERLTLLETGRGQLGLRSEPGRTVAELFLEFDHG